MLIVLKSMGCHLLMITLLFGTMNVLCEGGSSNDALKITTRECQLTEPLYGNTFDFTTLRSDLAHTTTSKRQDLFEYNICGKIAKKCEGRSDVAACMRRGDKEHILGIEHELNYINGKIFFTFLNGSECSAGKQYQLHVIIGCDYTLDEHQSSVTQYAEEECSFYITLETPLACLPQPDEVKSNNCTATDPHTGYLYNLLPLSDYNYRTFDRSGSAFILNVCKPVLYGQGTMCPPGSSVCFYALKSQDYKKTFFNYGTVAPNPIIENDKLLMRMLSDTKCNATHNYTSVITFYCDQKIAYGQPDFMGQRGCIYEFWWPTRMACNNNIESCVVMDPISGFKYNFTSLKSKPMKLEMKNTTYTFAICSDAGPPCLEHDGSCNWNNSQTDSLGISNSDLRFNHTGSPYLLYESGAECQKNSDGSTIFWSTKIEFVCATKDSGPSIIEYSNCQLLIHYATELACQKQITCKAKGYQFHGDDDIGSSSIGYETDLTPLISTTQNYEAQIGSSISPSKAGKSTKFYLNVCRPLVPKFGLGCPGGSAACMAVMGNENPEQEQSLGYPEISVIAINRTSAELKYVRGSPCPHDKQKQLSSTIQFNCDTHAGRGTPVLTSIEDECHYKFIWATNVICQTHLCKFDADNCEIINSELNESYNIRDASFTNNGKIEVRDGKKKMSIDICGPHRKALTDYSQGTVKIFFNTEGACGTDGTVNVQLRLICSPGEENAFSSSDGNQCNIIHTQRTPDICKFLGLSAPTINSIRTTTSSTLRTTTAATDKDAHVTEKTKTVGAILGAIATILLFFSCVGLLIVSPDRRERVLSFLRRRASVVRYSRVDANEEANLLLDHNHQIADSDDDMLL